MKTLITRSFKLDEQQKQQLADLGLAITYQQDEAAEVADPEQYETVIGYDLFSHNDISRFAGLRYIQLTSAGTDHLPLAEIAERGIMLKNARGVYSAPMAEFVIGGLLQLYKSSRQFWQQQQQHQWRRLRGLQELAAKQVCIIGAGSIGCALAKRLQAFDCYVQGVNPSPVGAPGAAFFERIWRPEELAEVLPQADIVILALPLLPATRGLFDAPMFARMKAGAVFVNVARGPIVDEEALLAALRSGRLGGAVLDVFEQEPLAADSPLWDMPNVVATPHNSFLAESNQQMMFKVIYQNLQDYLSRRKN